MFEGEPPGDHRIARVLLDSTLPQLDHLFDYAIPDALADQLRVGQRVRVPFRSQTRQSFGYIVEFGATSEFGGDLHQISEAVGPVPVLTPEVWRLARAVADRAGGSACDILRLAIPQRMVRVEKQHLAALEAADTVSSMRSTDSRLTSASDTTKVEHPEAEGAAYSSELPGLLVTGSRVNVLTSHGPVRLSTGEWVGGWALQVARTAIEVWQRGRSVVVVLPDYRDLDQLRDTLAALGHPEVVRVDARQSKGERYANFLRALEMEPRIVLGNRSAVYAPAFKLGAILMWDDGDPLLSEPLAPYVHARDAALVRAEQSGAGLCFFSHSRSIEVQRLVELGYVKAERLPPRRTRVVHADASVVPDEFAGRVPEFAARAIRAAVEHGPVLVQVATPGYAPMAVCGDCGTPVRCAVCAGPIGFRAAGRGACRWCGEHVSRWSCGECGGTRLQERGMGSQRTVEQFQRQFSGVRIVLSDGEHPHERLDSRPALVVATRGAEPIAAGGYRAVVLLDAERLLGIESLRAGEDCLRWWENAAALAAPDGQVIVASGGGPVVRAFVTGRTEEWRRQELRERQLLRYPPAVRVASVTGGPTEVARAIESLAEEPGLDILGPTAFLPRDSAAAREATAAGLVRAIVRFEYARGGEVAKRLRGALVADAAGSTSRAVGRRPGRARPTALRLRFDDRSVFDG